MAEPCNRHPDRPGEFGFASAYIAAGHWRDVMKGPDRCMDDLCRGSDVGMCGALSDRLLGINDTEDYGYFDEDDE